MQFPKTVLILLGYSDTIVYHSQILTNSHFKIQQLAVWTKWENGISFPTLAITVTNPETNTEYTTFSRAFQALSHDPHVSSAVIFLTMGGNFPNL